MRHGRKHNHLSRTKEARKALLLALSRALVEHKAIFTTLAKARALRMHIEPLLTKARQDTTHARRQVFSHFQRKEPVKTIFSEILPVIGNRPGGYTRIIKLNKRKGDGADMAYIELVDFSIKNKAAGTTSPGALDNAV